MSGSKSMFASVGIMGPAVGIVVFILNYLAGDEIITDADAQEVINYASLLLGSLVGIWGRYTATKEIS